jgi:hypothetical protein
MDANLKKKLRALSLELRHILERDGDTPGDLHLRLNELGVWPDRPAKPLDELTLTAADRIARSTADAFLAYRNQAGVSREASFHEFVRESAYSWANRLVTLRCMEARGLIDPVIMQQEVYGNRSLVHYRFSRENPSACTDEDDGLFAVLDSEFSRRATELPIVFDPRSPSITLRPSVSALKRCISLLSGSQDDGLFEAGDTLGWAYQFWNSEEKDRVFERIRTEKGAKIEGADLIPATQLYTEPYMVKFLVQNSLGALWASMYPDSKLPMNWEYYARDADRTPPVHPDPLPFDPNHAPTPSVDPWVRPNAHIPVDPDIIAYARTLLAKVPGVEAGSFADLRNQMLDAAELRSLETLLDLNHKVCEAWDREWPARRSPLRKRAAEITFLDPACGSGHFLLEAFNLLYEMYQEDDPARPPEEICATILNQNLYGVDIDERAIQIAHAVLWMHAAERAPKLRPELVTMLGDHLVAANLALPRDGTHLQRFLGKHPEDSPLEPALDAIFRGLTDADQLGTLLRIEEDVEQALQRLRDEEDRQRNQVLRESQAKMSFKSEHYPLEQSQPRTDYAVWKREVLERLSRHFAEEARLPNLPSSFFGHDAHQGLALFELLARRYDVVAANPPYLGHGKCGPTVDRCLSRYIGSADLYAAFLERSLQLADSHGAVGILSLSSYLSSDDYVDVRAFLLNSCQIQVLVNLSNRTFEGLSNPNAVFFSMAVFAKSQSTKKEIHTFDLEGFDLDQKRDALLDCLSAHPSYPERLSICRQTAFSLLPGKPIAFNLPLWAQKAFESGRYVRDFADARQGLITGDNERFLRLRWEVSLSERWVRYAKGGTFRRWAGNDEWAVDWEFDGARLRHFTDDAGDLRSRPQNIQYFFTDGCSWSSNSVSAFGVRRLEHRSAFDAGGSSAFPKPGVTTTEALMGGFTTPSFGQMYSAIQPGANFREGYLQSLPFPSRLSKLDDFDAVIATCLRLQQRLQEFEITSESFGFPTPIENNGLRAFCTPLLAEKIGIQLELHDYECRIWDRVEAEYEVPERFRTTVRRYDVASAREDDTIGHFLDAVAAAKPQPAALPWRATQNKVEEALVSLRTHPTEVRACLARDARQEVLGRSMSDASDLARALVTAMALRVLGHSWTNFHFPKNLVAVQAAGIAPLTELRTEAPLANKIADMLLVLSESPNDDFEEITGTPILRWLARGFFQEHVSQFRNRPVAWQVETRPSGKGATPIFSCLIYCQRLTDALPTLRTYYAGTLLRVSFESELRTLETLDSLTDDQKIRKLKLETWIDELERFQDSLEEVETKGFATSSLRRFSIQDAVHSLTRRWLGRLRDQIRQGPLAAWREKASSAGFPPELPSWIAAAVDRVDRQCIALAPELPALETPDDHLMPTDLAELFDGRANLLVQAGVRAICSDWQEQFDRTMLQPLRDQVKAAEAKVKELPETIENVVSRRELRSEIKRLRKLLADLAAQSGTLASVIEEWQCPDSELWADWLKTQPLYDEISSVDGRRQPPATVAEFIAQESQYQPDTNDGVRVNIAPLQKAGLLARSVLAAKDIDRAIAERAEWRADERRWVRQGILPQPGWWPSTQERSHEIEAAR